MEIQKYKGNYIPGLNPVCEGCSNYLGMNQVNMGTLCRAVTENPKGVLVKPLIIGEDGIVDCESYSPDLPSRFEKFRSQLSSLIGFH